MREAAAMALVAALLASAEASKNGTCSVLQHLMTNEVTGYPPHKELNARQPIRMSREAASKAAEATARDVASATAAGTVCAEEAAPEAKRQNHGHCAMSTAMVRVGVTGKQNS